MAKIIVAGAAGRMGRMLISLVAPDRAHSLVGAVEAAGVASIGRDSGEVAGSGPNGILVSVDYASIAAPEAFGHQLGAQHRIMGHTAHASPPCDRILRM